jgi:hypothetical protein
MSNEQASKPYNIEPTERQRAYQQGWDDCLYRVYQVLGERFTLPTAISAISRHEALAQNIADNAGEK